jgi:hypothetical protein
MAIVYSYPGATPTISDTVLGTQFDYDGNPTKSFLIADIVNLVANTTVSNLTGSDFTLSALNSTYPNAMIGFKVQCPDSNVLKIYEKGTGTDWLVYPITLVT